MKKLMLIIAREVRLRLRRPSFWVLSVLVPAVLAVLYLLPVLAAQRGSEPTTVYVVDQTGLFDGSLLSTDEVHFHSMPSLDYARQNASRGYAVLFIPMRETTIPHDAFLYYHGDMPSVRLQSTVNNQLQTLLRNALLEDVYNLEPSAYHSIESTHISLHTRDADTGRDSFIRVRTIVAIVLALLMALALVVFGVQVMRSVQEEKNNRVAEVLATSVRPLQLLLGKSAGVALTAVAQLILWIALTAAAIAGIQAAAPDLFAAAREQQQARQIATKGVEATSQYNTAVQVVDDTVQGLAAVNLPLVAALFLLFFLLGYMLYGAVLAAIASRLDSEADALQWTLLVGSPLLLVVAVAPFIIRHPLFAIFFPFTAPSAVMLRLPFGIAVWQVGVSVAILLIAVAVAALLAARAYRRHLV